jgi:hypothetical protein
VELGSTQSAGHIIKCNDGITLKSYVLVLKRQTANSLVVHNYFLFFKFGIGHNYFQRTIIWFEKLYFVVFKAAFSNISVILIAAVSFIGGVNRSTRRKPPTCRKLLTNCILVANPFLCYQRKTRQLVPNIVYLGRYRCI